MLPSWKELVVTGLICVSVCYCPSYILCKCCDV